MTMAASAPACADPGASDLLSADTLTAYGDVRAVGVDGEQSWTGGGWGKARFGDGAPGGTSSLTFKPRLAEVDLVWKPRFSWAISGTVVGLAQGDDPVEPGLSEAYLSWKPLSDAPVHLSARLGLMWPPISLEHSGPEWSVRETITPSAINSWVGEEVKVVGSELNASLRLGSSKVALTATLFDANDTAGALLAFRGWALHDRKLLAFRSQELPPLNAFLRNVQPEYTHSLIEMDGGYLKRPGYFARLAWDAPLPLHVELVRYDNGANPKSVNADQEWGWRTRFDDVALVAQPAARTQIRAQFMTGRTQMGYPKNGVDWVDMRFRAGYLLVTRYVAGGSISARADLFSTRNRGSRLTGQDDEDGWALTAAARRDLGPHFTALAEYLRVESRRAARLRSGLADDQATNQLQLSLRASW